MAVNNARVIGIIGDALALHAAEPGCCGTVEQAFRDLQAQRRVPGASLDEDLAAAEHYMYARFTVCTGGISKIQMDAMVVGYETVKGILQAVGLDSLMQTTANPTAPASQDSVIWGLAGSLAGKQDHDRCNSGVEAPVYNREAYGYGSRYGSAY